MNVGRPLLVAILALLGAGCGSATPRSSTDPSSSSNPGAAAFKYADCIRAHGVTGFPDPRVHVSGDSVSVIQGVPASAAASPRFKSAQRACQGIIPPPGNAVRSDQPKRRRVFLAFGRCMRAHGVSDFPDPNPQGQITPAMLSASGVDLHSRPFLDAALGCVGVTNGAITRADVYAVVNGHH